MVHYNSLRKYTLALLSTFNDLEVAYLSADGLTPLSKKIPIKFSTREKATILDEHETSQILSGNYNALPRAALVLTSVIKAETRATNKYTKHNITQGDVDSASFNYAPQPYEFMYELVIQCRGMNEASMIIEQVAPRFNPNYTIRINEAPNSAEATSIPLSLLDISIEPEEYEEISTNIMTLSMGIGLKGNFYPPAKVSPKVKDLKIYNSYLFGDNEFARKSLMEWDVENNVAVSPRYTPLSDTEVPEVFDVEGVFALGDVPVTSIYKDDYNKPEELIFIWSVVSGDATITTGKENEVLTVNSGVSVTVRCQIVDVHGNTSNIFDKIL